MSARRHPARVYTALKTATRHVLDCCGPLKAAAHYTRLSSTSCLQRFGSACEDDATRFMPIDVAVDLMQASGDISILHAMADALDCDVAPKSGTAPEALAASARGVSDMGRLISDLAAVMADGEITACEIDDRDLVAHLRTVMDSCSQLKHALEQAVKA